ncbi:hypothetical protein GGI43DRAFT_212603 [Trichoderma evansii]
MGLHMRCDVSAVASILLVQSTVSSSSSIRCLHMRRLWNKCFGAESSFVDDIFMRIVCQNAKNLRGSFHEQGLSD